MKSLLDVINENIWDQMPKIEDWDSNHWDVGGLTKSEGRARINSGNWSYRYIAITHPRMWTKKFDADFSPEARKIMHGCTGYLKSALERDLHFQRLKNTLMYGEPTVGLSKDYNTPIESEYYCWYPNREEEESKRNSYDELWNGVTKRFIQWTKKNYKGLIFTIEKTDDSITVRIPDENNSGREAFVTFERGFYTDEMRRKGIKLPNT